MLSKLFFSSSVPPNRGDVLLLRRSGQSGRARSGVLYARVRRDAFEVSVTTEESSSCSSRQGEGKVSGLALPPCCEGNFTLWAMRCHSATPRRSLGPVDNLRRLADVRLIREAPATLTRSARPGAVTLTGDVADTDGGRGFGFLSWRGAPGFSFPASLK